MAKLIYKQIIDIEDDEAIKILLHGSEEDFFSLPLSVGHYHTEWKKAQHICLKLAEHENPQIRSNAILGLSYIANTSKKLDKHLVKPHIIREYRENIEHHGTIVDAIVDINLFLGWHILEKQMKKREE